VIELGKLVARCDQGQPQEARERQNPPPPESSVKDPILELRVSPRQYVMAVNADAITVSPDTPADGTGVAHF
jgi:hypothetical protein